MSKKRLYEIAKEVGVESKVVVAKAQELGLSVKSHSSSVEEADANRITSSLKGRTAKAESKPAPKATPTPKEEKVAPKVDKVPVAKSAPAKETSKAEVKEAPATPKNHKAVILRQNVKHVPRQKQSVVKTAEAVTTVIVTEINKGTIKVNVRIMIVAAKMEMVKETVIMGTAITIVIVTVISKVNSAMIKVEINVTMLPVTIRQVHVLTLKRVQQP